MADVASQAAELKFRDPVRARALTDALARETAAIGRDPVNVMHVCGSHEQAIARFGLRAAFPRALQVIMGPGCPVCVTDTPEVDEAVALAAQGARVCTYGDMLKLPGTSKSLNDIQGEGGKVEVVYSISQAVALAERHPDEEIVFFGSGFETTAVATAAAILAGVPRNFSVLSSHKWVPAAMEVVASLERTNIEGYIAAGHAAIITGYGIFEEFARRTGAPVVVAGFEPLDVLAALVKLAELVKDRRPEVSNMYPRCVTREGNRPAQERLWKVFQPVDGDWRGIARVPSGNLDLRPELAHVDARKRFAIDTSRVGGKRENALAKLCRCGEIMSGLANPHDCTIFGQACTPDAPVGACMVSSEGACRIWYQYGGLPDLSSEVSGVA
jgi:hydrogenase expression/formation protein HypD